MLNRRRAPMKYLRLATALLLVPAACDRDSAPARAPRLVADSTASPSAASRARLASLEHSFHALEDGVRAAPRDRWDPNDVVRTVGRDPRHLFAWVRDNTNWIPYRGVLRGPVGVLLDRQGNSLDRALLLAALLETAGHSVRLAHGALSREQAHALLPTLVARDAELPIAPREDEIAATPDVRAVAARYQLDGATIERSFALQGDAVTRFYSELEARVADQSERLLRTVHAPDPRADWDQRFESAETALRDHWWVQRQDGGNWVDMDLLAGADSTWAALAPATETTAAKDLAAGLHHELVVRVVGEQWANGTLSERPVLEHVLRPADLYGQPIVLQFWPGEWPAELHSDPNSALGLRGAALEQREWGVALAVRGDAVAQAVIGDDGSLREPASGGPFGGLGSGIAGAVRSPRQEQSRGPRARELAAAWIEYELRAPGEAPRTIRRAVFDLIGPAARSASAPALLAMDDTKRLTRSLALMIRTEILPVTCRLAPEYVMHLSAQGLLANQRLLRTIAQSEPAALPDADTLLAAAAPPVSTLYSLALARLTWSPVGDRLLVDRLGLLTRHRHPAVTDAGFGMRGAVDVVAGEMGVSLAEPDAFGARLQQGVMDTNAEALWWQGVTVLNAGEAFKTARDWLTLTSPQRAVVGGLRLPDDARARISQDLAAGFVVVAPKAPVPAGPEHFIGWWRIDPVTGTARGVAGNGWGQCEPEYGITVRAVLIQAARSFAFEYYLCQAIQQSVNSFRFTGAALQQRGLWFWWLPPIRSEDPLGLFKKSNKACLIGAMMGGMLATLPILLQVRRAAELTAAARSRPTLSSLDNFTPNRPTPRPKGYPRPPDAPGRPGPAGTLPGGTEPPANPLGKTDPGLPKTEPDLVKTQPDPPMPPTERPPAPPRPRPLTEAEARENLRKANEAREAARDQSADAAGEFVRYRATKSDPSAGWHPDMDKALYNDWQQAHQKSINAIDDWRKAQNAAADAAAAARGARGGGGFPAPNRAPQQPPAPNLPGCPPNCGNNNPTGPAGAVQVPGASASDQIAVGSGGVASSFYPFPWNP